MAGIWSLIDARGPWPDGVDPDTRVAGLSLIARHVRLAGRCGLAGVMIRTDGDRARSALRAALDRQPPPGVEVEHLAGDAPIPLDGDRARVVIPMDLHAVYTVATVRAAVAAVEAGVMDTGASDAADAEAADAEVAAAEAADAEAAASKAGAPAPLARIGSRADLATAEDRLFTSIRKSIDQDGVIAYYTQRPIARPLTRLLIDTPVTPNHVSLMAMACGIVAAVLAGVGGAALVAVAGVLYWLGAVIDCIDGDLARLRLQGSKLGEWLDTLADDVSTYGLLVGLCAGLWRDGLGLAWASFGLIAAALGTLAQIKMYADLHRLGGTIDTAQYPWFFGTPSEGAGDRRTPIGWLFYGISFLFRRDAFVTLIGVLLLLGQRIASVAILAGGISVVVVLLAVHLVVSARGRRAT